MLVAVLAWRSVCVRLVAIATWNERAPPPTCIHCNNMSAYSEEEDVGEESGRQSVSHTHWYIVEV